MAVPDKDREAFLAQAGRLYDEMIAKAGPQSGDTFDDIEEQAEAAGQQLVLRLLAQRLAAEHARQPAQVLCPNCHHPMRAVRKPRERNLDTASGVVNYARGHAICDRCGVSFSPSGLPAEDSPPRPVGPPEPDGL